MCCSAKFYKITILWCRAWLGTNCILMNVQQCWQRHTDMILELIDFITHRTPDTKKIHVNWFGAMHIDDNKVVKWYTYKILNICWLHNTTYFEHLDNVCTTHGPPSTLLWIDDIVDFINIVVYIGLNNETFELVWTTPFEIDGSWML